jgi:hypothetical protein
MTRTPRISRTLITVVVAVLVLVGLGGVALATSGGSAITQARLERSVDASFANVYAQEAALLGHHGVTPATLRTRAMCDKGPGVAQSGPGTSWICLVSWHDPNVPMPSTGYGKLELTVHSNGCYTASSPSSLVGYQTITAADGRTVNNPAYEYDACLDPDGDDTPTGVRFPSAISITSTTATLDASRHVSVDLACATGAGGCVGTITATAGGHTLGTVPFHMTENATASLPVPLAVPAGAKQVTYTMKATSGIAVPATTLSVQG